MQNDLYIQLLYKQLSGEIEPGEQQELNVWLAESAEHRQIAAAIEKVWEMGDHYQPTDLPEINLDMDFALLEKRIAVAEKPVRQLKPRTNVWLRIAAAAVVILLSGFLVRQWMGGETQWQTLATVTGEQKEVTLADGSQVWLNENTEIQYPQDFSGDLREIKLKGEAFFAVEKNPDQAFVVYTNSGSVRVLGTSFNVRDLTDEEIMKVQVKTGKVEVDNKDKSAQVILTAGEQAQLDKTQNTLVKLDTPIGNALFWQTGILIFSNQPLSQALRELETAYKVQIRLDNKEMEKCLMTSTFTQKSIKQVLNTIATVFEMELVVLDEKTYRLKAGRCQ